MVVYSYMVTSEHFYSIEQVASQLGLHVRTVRNYVRDGRLKGVRIGKQYRIARADLDALTGHGAPAAPAVASGTTRRHVEVSSIVQIEAIDFAAAEPRDECADGCRQRTLRG